jgi:hypothetical protein
MRVRSSTAYHQSQIVQVDYANALRATFDRNQVYGSYSSMNTVTLTDNGTAIRKAVYRQIHDGYYLSSIDF